VNEIVGFMNNSVIYWHDPYLKNFINNTVFLRPENYNKVNWISWNEFNSGKGYNVVIRKFFNNK
jgi:hypothetical protein